ncbi:MAG: ornithine cyclodeaminase family protein, partial [Chloroflexota bacterium]
ADGRDRAARSMRQLAGKRDGPEGLPGHRVISLSGMSQAIAGMKEAFAQLSAGTATTSTSPVLDGRDLKPGAHVNAVGSFTPEMQEVDVVTIERSLVVVDSRQAALAEAGDLIVPMATGRIDEKHIVAEIGLLAAGRMPGRTDARQITYFKSVGVAVQDAAAARIAHQNARLQSLGAVVAL